MKAQNNTPPIKVLLVFPDQVNMYLAAAHLCTAYKFRPAQSDSGTSALVFEDAASVQEAINRTREIGAALFKSKTPIVTPGFEILMLDAEGNKRPEFNFNPN